MRKILTLLLLSLSLSVMAQDRNYPQQWSAAEASKANTAANVAEMDAEAREVVYLMNLARLDGAKFWNTYVVDNLGGRNNSYVQSLKRDLQAVKNLPMLVPDGGLINAAKYHANDMSKNNFFDHNSSDGTGCFERMNRYYKGGYRGENISSGYNTAIGVVLQLLVDEGVSSLGHRKNILSSNYKAVGVAFATHKSYRYCCVEDFGDNVLHKVSGGATPPSNNGGQTNPPSNNNNNNNSGGGSSHGKRLRDNDGGSVSGGGNGNSNGNDNRNSPSRTIKPKRPTQQDARLWKFDEELELWRKDEGNIVYFWDKESQLCLYYDTRTETLYVYDEDGRQWIDTDDLDDDDFDISF